MSAPGRPDEVWRGRVVDAAEPHPILESQTAFTGHKWDIRTDRVDFGTGVAVRDIMLHPGAVGIMVLDEGDRVLLIRQYRLAVAMSHFEPPARLLDVAGAEAFATAKRETIE